MRKIFRRVSIFLKLIKKIKNSHLVFLVYFGLYRKSHFTLVLRNGVHVKLRTISTDIQAFANVWIIEEYKRRGFEIKDCDVIIDIGAHVGLFALYASQYCRSGRIFCFEPIKENFDLLVENIKINNLTNVKCFNKAVYTQNKNVRIYLSNDQAAHSIYGNGNAYIDVNAVTLSDILNTNDIEICNLLKMDCEGSEYEILQSTSDEYINRIQKICLEYHIMKNDHELLHSLKNRFLSLDFQVINVPSIQNLGMLYVRKSGLS